MSRACSGYPRTSESKKCSWCVCKSTRLCVTAQVERGRKGHQRIATVVDRGNFCCGLRTERGSGPLGGSPHFALRVDRGPRKRMVGYKAPHTIPTLIFARDICNTPSPLFTGLSRML